MKCNINNRKYNNHRERVMSKTLQHQENLYREIDTTGLDYDVLFKEWYLIMECDNDNAGVLIDISKTLKFHNPKLHEVTILRIDVDRFNSHFMLEADNQIKSDKVYLAVRSETMSSMPPQTILKIKKHLRGRWVPDVIENKMVKQMKYLYCYLLAEEGIALDNRPFYDTKMFFNIMESFYIDCNLDKNKAFEHYKDMYNAFINSMNVNSYIDYLKSDLELDEGLKWVCSRFNYDTDMRGNVSEIDNLILCSPCF